MSDTPSKSRLSDSLGLFTDKALTLKKKLDTTLIIKKITRSRKELLRYLDQYLEALTANDPWGIPLAYDVRFTENTRSLKLGEGLWKTASAVKYRYAVADPLQGQGGVFCTLQEGDEHLTLLALRLKVVDKKIAEIETIVSRYTGRALAFKPETLVVPNPILTEVVPVSERLPRDKMIAIADLYLEGLEKNSAEFIPLHKDCNRVENGLQTTNNPDLGFITSLSCVEQIPIFTYMTKIRDRRYPVVDEEFGLVWCLVMFDVPGTVKTAELPGYGVVELPPRTQIPRSALVAELFKIRNGQIHYIEAILTGVPLGTRPGWPV
jgi:hypothetical protein